MFYQYLAICTKPVDTLLIRETHDRTVLSNVFLMFLGFQENYRQWSKKLLTNHIELFRI